MIDVDQVEREAGHDRLPKLDPRHVLARFLPVYLPIGLLCALLAWWIADARRTAHEEHTAEHQSSLLRRDALSIDAALAGPLSDAVSLAGMAAYKLSTQPDDTGEWAPLQRLFLAFAEGKPGYTSVRFVDSGGRDVVRVDREPQGPRLTESEPSTHQERPSVVSGGLGTLADIWISRLDLAGHRPLLWLSAPVASGGRRAGIVVLGVDARPLLSFVRGAKGKSTGELFFIGEDGSWLVAPAGRTQQALRPGARESFREAYPGAWDGSVFVDRTVRTEQGLFTQHVINPGESRLPSAGSLRAEAEQAWALVAYASREQLVPPWWRWMSLLVVSGLVVLAIIVLLVTVARLRRQQVMNAIRASEEKLRRIASTVQDAIIMVDSEGRVRYWNAGASRMLGYDETESLGRDLHSFVTGGFELRQAHTGLTAFRETGRGPLVGRLQRVRANRKDGTTFPAELSISALRNGEEWWAVGSLRDMTYREEAEQALRESERRMREMLDTVRLVAVMLDASARVLYTNDFVLELLGWSREELLGADWCALVHADPDPIRGSIQEAIRTGTVLPRIETTLLTRSGEERQIVFSNTLLRDADGAPAGITSIGLDVTEARRNEQTARLLQRFVSSSSSGLTIVDATSEDMPLVECNPAYERMMGSSRDDLIGTPWRALLPDDVDEGALEQLGAAVAMGGEGHAELLARRLDGQPFWMEVAVSPVLDTDGQPTHYVSVLADITGRKDAEEELRRHRDHLEDLVKARASELLRANASLQQEIAERRRAEELLRRSQRRLNAVQQLGGLGSWEYDLTSRRIVWSQESYRIHGRRPEDGPPTLKEYLRSILPEDRPAFEAVISSLNTVDVSERVLVRHLRPDGSIVHVLGQAQRVMDGERLVAIWGSALDVTQAQRSAAELEAARDAAQAANRAKSSFLATMSHEIRSPLNAVIGLVDLTLRTDLTAKQRDYLDAVQSAGRSLSFLIDDILELSKIEAERLELVLKPLCLRSMIDDLVVSYRPKVAETGLELVVRVDLDVPDGLVGDEHRLRQVLVNLVGNAFKFTERGEIVLHVSVVERDEERVTLRFSVRDTGIGIAADKRDRLFEPFVQADSSITRNYGGTGLGLTISRRIVALMGGSLDLTSTEGEGSEFFFSVGFEPVPSEREQLRVPPLRDLRTLVVDDSDATRELIRYVLDSVGVPCETVVSAEEAIGLLHADEGLPFGMLLLDVSLPGLSALDVARSLRADGRTRGLPIVLMSAVATSELEAECEALGLGFLPKPLSASSLIDAMAGACGRGAPISRRRARAPREVEADLSGRYVLLAEDNDVNRFLATELLAMWGVGFDIAEDGAEAVRLVRERGGRYAAVLMDVQMPVMDGLTATRRIRELPRGHGLPIIAMTANAMRGDREACLDAGMDDFITKPIDANRMRDVLARRMRDLAPRASADAPSSLQALPGIDAAAALARLGLPESVFRQLLVRFRDNDKDAALRMQQALSSSDRDAALRLAHTIKGGAGTIGASELQEAASALELALQQGNGDVGPLAAAFEASAGVVFEGLARLG